MVRPCICNALLGVSSPLLYPGCISSAHLDVEQVGAVLGEQDLRVGYLPALHLLHARLESAPVQRLERGVHVVQRHDAVVVVQQFPDALPEQLEVHCGREVLLGRHPRRAGRRRAGRRRAGCSVVKCDSLSAYCWKLRLLHCSVLFVYIFLSVVL